jgi:hypothetical protein
MNRVYTLPFTVGLFLMVNAPKSSLAQCGFCSGGVPAIKVTQVIPVGPSSNSSTTITFKQFNDASGKTFLSCLSFDDTLSATSGFDVVNTDPAATIYKFNTDINYTIKGPGTGGGINVSEDSSMKYGPDTLAAKNQPGSTITLGPDVYFNHKASNVSADFTTAPYSGSGTLDITLTFGGGASAIGGVNYGYTINTTFTAVFKLTYYICPSVALANSIEDFTAIRTGDVFNIQWLTANEQNNTNYEIQVSTDGKTFSNGGEIQSDATTAGTTAKYEYKYNADPTNVGKIYFRIKRTDASGKVTYSAILTISDGMSADGSPGFRTYPNPATNSLMFQFDENQTGHYMIELISASGQIVQRKATTLTGASQIRLDLIPQPVRGLYFLRTSDLSHNRQFVNKVFIE